MCGINRLQGEAGVCGQSAELYIASIGPHHGEEPPISGTKGSGTIFFTGCSSRCFFCQNYQISLLNKGKRLSYKEFLKVAIKLVQSGVHNLNFVTGDHYWPHIERLCRDLRKKGFSIPFVLNSSGFMKPEMVERMAEIMDIFLPDFKYAHKDLSREIIGDERYPELALNSIKCMVKQRDFLDSFDDPEATAKQGVLIRHLILPGNVQNTIDILDILHDNFGTGVPLSVMSQYRPTPNSMEQGEFSRPVSQREHGIVQEKVLELGFENVFIQPEHGDHAFMPDFDQDRPFQGNP
jgi:putative pyruvate formate lyase activating enzyme